jgi:hypothetical protein
MRLGVENMRITALICLFLAMTAFAAAQEQGWVSRGSIPDELLRPRKGEAPRYPVDTVIGELGKGKASDAAYSFANSVASGLLSADTGHPVLAGISAVLRESYLSALNYIEPVSFRIGGGREEPDGAVSFMIRFFGKEREITGELYIRFVTKQTEKVLESEREISAAGSWIFEDLILDDPKSRYGGQRESLPRFDFPPYERFF